MIDKTELLNARKMHRQMVEELYEGTCNIYEKTNVTDPVTKITGQKEKMIYENAACRLSYTRVTPSYKQAEGAKKEQLVKLFLAPEMLVRPGSKIVVTQNNVTETYKMSSLAAAYTSHQEIALEAWKGWN